jgi:hypothetical protein
MTHIYHPVLSQNLNILKLVDSPQTKEQEYQKLQKWTISSLSLFLHKYLVFGPNFVKISAYYADDLQKRSKLLVNLYWLVKKQFKLDKIR